VPDDRDRQPPKAIPLHALSDEDTGIHARVKRLSEGYAALTAEVGRQGEQIDAVREDLADVRETSARSEGKLDVLVEGFRSVTTIHTERTTSDIQVATARAKTAIEDAADAKKARRAVFSKLLVTAIGSAGLLELLHRWAGC
jgi:hypothetical protein